MVSYVDLERELGVFIRRSLALRRELAAAVHPDLEPSSYTTLVRIQQMEPARASELADYFGIDKSAISRQIHELGRLGLVERTVDAEDGRAYALRLTSEGQHRLTEAGSVRRARLRQFISGWSTADTATFTRLLSELNREFAAHLHGPELGAPL